MQLLVIQSEKLVAVEKPVQKVLEKVEGWLDTFISMLPNMAVALLLFLIFLVLAKLGRKFLIKSKSRFHSQFAHSIGNDTLAKWNK